MTLSTEATACSHHAIGNNSMWWWQAGHADWQTQRIHKSAEVGACTDGKIVHHHLPTITQCTHYPTFPSHTVVHLPTPAQRWVWQPIISPPAHNDDTAGTGNRGQAPSKDTHSIQLAHNQHHTHTLALPALQPWSGGIPGLPPAARKNIQRHSTRSGFSCVQPAAHVAASRLL